LNTPTEIEDYLKSCQSAFWQAVFRAESDYLLRHITPGKEILSVGCGPAIIESALSAHGCRVTGLDVSREALGRAPDPIRAVVGRAEDMPFPADSFDAVIYVASLQFIENFEEALRGTRQVLRPRGKLLAMLLNPASQFFQTKLLDPNSYLHHIRHMDLQAIEKAIAADFIVQSEYHLGIRGEVLFPSQDPREAALYTVRGGLKTASGFRHPAKLP
jgi:ubiquinone/menaquinone biosynthesis C-methylase UbiE